MIKMPYLVAIAAAVLLGVYIGPGLATTQDLSRWGGFECNAESVDSGIECDDCDDEYTDFTLGEGGMFCTDKISVKQCPADHGCTNELVGIQCTSDCEQP
jgi:hypothetical protein